MATNEDLAVAFLCMCDTKDRESILEFIDYTLSRWEDTENKDRIIEAIRLPHSLIQRKISLLHTGLHACPQKKKIYEEMGNRLGMITATLRSPLLNSLKESTGFKEPNDYVIPFNLYPKESSKE